MRSHATRLACPSASAGSMILRPCRPDAVGVNLRQRLLMHGVDAPGLAADELHHGVGGQDQVRLTALGETDRRVLRRRRIRARMLS
jgi:hypothetical protein